MNVPAPTDTPLNEWHDKYRRWIRANPQVRDLAVKYALVGIRRGRRFSIHTMLEAMRWNAPRTWQKDEQGFKINDAYMAYFARDLIRVFPELKALVELRRVRGEEDVTESPPGSAPVPPTPPPPATPS